MKRLASLVLASSFMLGSMVGMDRAASATPFSDVPANHWAYQYIQSLAADGLIDGYPDGKFKGDRPLTRYEMAVVVARVIAKLQENEKPYTGPDETGSRQAAEAHRRLKDELDESASASPISKIRSTRSTSARSSRSRSRCTARSCPTSRSASAT
jgi:hypothetical protein